MYSFSNEEYADIIFVYGFCNGNARHAAREYRIRFPERRQPAHSVFSTSFRRLRMTGNAAPQKSIRPHEVNVQDEENIIEAVMENPAISTRRVSRNLGLSQSFVWRVLNREVLHPYHRQNVQALQPGDAQQRLRFSHWILHQHTQDNNFLSNILWSDESTFSRDGINNFHNDHVWSLNNPHVVRSRRFQQRFSVNVWGGLFNNTLLPLTVFNGTLNANMYYEFLDNTLFDFLDDIPLQLRRLMWYQ